MKIRSKLTMMLYGGRFASCASRTPSEAFGGPGSSSTNSSASTRTRTTSDASIYIREDVGVSKSEESPSATEGSANQKCARSWGSLCLSFNFFGQVNGLGVTHNALG
jgi:hypothetical protein